MKTGSKIFILLVISVLTTYTNIFATENIERIKAEISDSKGKIEALRRKGRIIISDLTDLATGEDMVIGDEQKFYEITADPAKAIMKKRYLDKSNKSERKFALGVAAIKNDSESLDEFYTRCETEAKKEEDNLKSLETRLIKAEENNSKITLMFAQAAAENLKREAQESVAAAGAKASMNAFFDNFKSFIDNPRHMTKLIGYSGAGVLTLTGTYYAVNYIYNYKMSTMHKPTLVRETSLSFSSGSFLEKFWGNGKKEIYLNDIVLPPAIKEQAHKLAQAARQMYRRGLPFENLLIYGPPGTGKTAFIRLLAKYSDMDYVILSGADFCQFKNGEGITELHKLFDLARNSKNGLVIFIDEADACFRSRLEVSTELVNLINAFLAETGESSKKVLVALATNYDGILDSAVRSRMHNKIAFMLPSQEDRLKIFKLKLKKHILDETYRSRDDQGKVIEEKLFRLSNKLDDSFWENIATITQGFSGRDIDFTMQAIRRELELSDATVLTPEIVTGVIDLKIKEIARDLKITHAQKTLYEQTRNTSIEY